MTRERAVLLAHLDAERQHVLTAVEGLSEPDLTRAAAPSGWSIAQLLNHLTYDDDNFWVGAILGGDTGCIGLIQDGWKVPVASGADAVAQYDRWRRRSDAVLADVDLDGAPRWWPPGEVSPFPPFADARACVFRLLIETATHAGTSTSLGSGSTAARTSWSASTGLDTRIAATYVARSARSAVAEAVSRVRRRSRPSRRPQPAIRRGR